MRRWYWLGLLPGIAVIATASVSATITYYKDVVPILQNHCQSCHRPNQLAPISFLTYRETRAWAEVIKQVVAAQKMPPAWSEDKAGLLPGKHGNLTTREISLIVTWVEEGAAAGDPHDAPPPLYFDKPARTDQPRNLPPAGSAGSSSRGSR